VGSVPIRLIQIILATFSGWISNFASLARMAAVVPAFGGNLFVLIDLLKGSGFLLREDQEPPE
jgi:hypothetical protein